MTHKVDYVTKNGLPKDNIGTFLLLENVHDCYKNQNELNTITIESVRNSMSQLAPRVSTLGKGDVAGKRIVPNELFDISIEISSRPLSADRRRRYAIPLGSLLGAKEKVIKGEVPSARVVVRVFVTMKQTYSKRVKLRLRFRYTIESKVDPNHGVERPAPS